MSLSLSHCCAFLRRCYLCTLSQSLSKLLLIRGLANHIVIMYFFSLHVANGVKLDDPSTRGRNLLDFVCIYNFM